MSNRTLTLGLIVAILFATQFSNGYSAARSTAGSVGNTVATLQEAVQTDPAVIQRRVEAVLREALADFRQKQIQGSLRAAEDALRGYIEGRKAGIDDYLDWQYSFLTKVVVTINGARDAANWCWEGANAVLGRQVPITPNLNRQLSVDAFERMVISEIGLRRAVRSAAGLFDEALRGQTLDLVAQLNRDVAEVLNREFRIVVPPQTIQRHVDLMLRKVAAQNRPIGHATSLVAGVLLSNYLAGACESAVASRVSAWLMANWYAHLSISGKLAAWMGLQAAPAVIGGTTGVVSSAVGFGVGVLAMVIVDRIYEHLTRPEARAALEAALDGLGRGLIIGDHETGGFRAQGEKVIATLADNIFDLYRQAVRQALVS